ncbi:hypothetical protein [Larkinella soli]|uniref:hypothetical protein n=1 Tax=Larkinella soli TaxID=1770527 RepID=UPI0013E3CDBB|nr:hypothetical protein [Larkinella soli]
MIGVKDAAHQAYNYLKELLPGIQDILLEEVEMDEERKHWLVTLSFFIKPERPTSPILNLTGFEKQYKTFKIDADNGEVLSMKIRELQK